MKNETVGSWWSLVWRGSIAGRVKTVAGLALALLGCQVASGTEAEIVSVRRDGKAVVVKASVKSSLARVVLESRSRFRGGSWTPVAVERVGASTNLTERTIEFRVPLEKASDFLRLRGDYTEVLPPRLYDGTNSFYSAGASQMNTMVGAPTAGDAKLETTAPAPRDVVESDIWKLDGDTLYFFNQYAGLQVIDVSSPDSAKLLGSYSAPAAGEEMYLLGKTVVLLTRDMCSYGIESESGVILLRTVNGQPEKIAQVNVTGSIRDSRLVGSILYVTTERYRPVPFTTNNTWEWGSDVTSIDLSDPAAPVVRDRLWLTGYGNAVYATDRYFFVAAPEWGSREQQSTVHIYDISDASGRMTEAAVLPVDGTVKDKFKMNLKGDVFTVVTENWSLNRETRVATYSLSDPKKPTKLGSVKIIEREALFATRFAGDLLYAVTFFVVDPLWVIDLSDPANPRKVGELEIPGWSTFIYPWGDRLVTIGIDATNNTRRTAVQLFDVHEPSKPTLVSKVLLGDQYSYSEGNSNEKAFGVLPEEGLILVPLYTYGTNGTSQGVQLVDLAKDGLRKRGFLERPLAPRRATMHRDRIISVSGRELVSVEATDRDKPKVTAEVTLSWPVDQVLLKGDYLLEFSNSTGTEPAWLRVALADSTSQVLKRVELGIEQLGGAEIRGDKLYLLQNKSSEILYSKPDWKVTGTNAAVQRMLVYDLSALPEVKLVGKTEHKFDELTYLANWYDGYWMQNDVVVWGVRNQNSYWGPYYFVSDVVGVGAPIAVDLARPGLISPGWGWGWGWGGSSAYFAYGTSNGDPQFLSSVTLNVTNAYNFGASFQHENLIYSSHAGSEFDATIIPPPSVYQKWDGREYTWVTNQPPPGMWIQRQYLDVIDFTDPKEPVVRKPVNIPGSLYGISHKGEMLYTQTYESMWDANRYVSSAKVQASAYDGVKASLVDTLELPEAYIAPLQVAHGYAYLGRNSTTNGAPGRVEVWRLVEQTGKFKLEGSTGLRSNPSNFSLHDNGRMLVVRDSGLELVSLSNPITPVPIGYGAISGCSYIVPEAGDGTVERGFWLPVPASMVQKIPVGAVKP